MYAVELAKALRRLGVTPFIAALGASPDRLDADTGGLPIFYHDCRLEWMDDPWEDVNRSGDWLLQLAERLDPDLIHLNGYAHAARSFRQPVLVVGHSCVYSWYWAVKGRAPSARWHAYREAVRAGLRAAGGVTAPTAFMLRALRRHYGDFSMVPPIPNGRRRIDFPQAPKRPFILSAGRIWDEAKNVGALARIAHRLSWPVAAAGAQDHPEGGRMTFDNVDMLGLLTQRQFSDWLSRASIYALPAFYEPFGLSVLEAGLAGCVLVLGDIPSLREIWDGAALFVPPARTDMLEAALIRLIGDERLRRELGGKARKRALGYTVEAMARAYAGLYETLAGRDGMMKGSRARPIGAR